MEEDILFLERLLREEPCPIPPINLNQAKSSIKEPEHSFSMGYEHFNTTLVTKLDKVAESSIKNLVPIPRKCEVTSDNEIQDNDSQWEEIDIVTNTDVLPPGVENDDDLDGFTPHRLKFLVFGYLSRSKRSSHPLIEISLGKFISFDQYCLAVICRLYA
nr:hypothetical protein [Tanacetum cinerariifolium]